jgi:hypothetical protein
VSLETNIALTEWYNILVKRKELICAKKKSDAIDEVSHKPMSL